MTIIVKDAPRYTKKMIKETKELLIQGENEYDLLKYGYKKEWIKKAKESINEARSNKVF